MNDPFSEVRDKRMSELTPAQTKLAAELWLRENVGWMTEYHRTHYQVLFDTIDDLRKQLAAVDDAKATMTLITTTNSGPAAERP